ncbi:hypothetical protein PI124_g18308 [Phytophthora idaei]|nr:hypothetical protein PI126_g18891 [Phytophthora idaei]KAG3236692.1 hypothetical protein PI124_g18308 [Phytophthora idaei]
MRLHPTFYVGRLKPDFPVDIPDLQPRLRGRARSSTFQNADAVGGSAQDAAARATTRLLTVGSLQKPQALKQLPTISLLTRCELRRITRLPLRAFRQVIRIQGVVSRLLRVGHHQSILLNRQPLQVLRRLGAPQSSNSRRNRRNWRTSRVTVRKCPFDVMVRSSIAMSREAPPRDRPKPNQKEHLACATEKHYRARSLGYSSVEDTWEARSRLLEEFPDVVSDYEASLALATTNVDSTASDDLVCGCARAYALLAHDGDRETAFECKTQGKGCGGCHRDYRDQDGLGTAPASRENARSAGSSDALHQRAPNWLLGRSSLRT